MKVQLLTFPGCPNAGAARDVLRLALESSGIRAIVEEVDTTAPDAPEELRGWGSPTILVNGRDVVNESPGGASCRLYRDAEGITRGTPDESVVRSALINLGRMSR